jgi:hypothetical protein
MTAPFNFGQIAFLKALTEALFHGADMVISADQVVANICDLFAKVGGTKRDEIALSLTATELVLGGPFFTEDDVAGRAAKVRDRLQNSQFDLFQDMARLRGIIYACYYGHWLPGDQDANTANPVHAQIGFTLPKHRQRGPNEIPMSSVRARAAGWRRPISRRRAIAC